MVLTLNARSALRLALIGAATVSMAACATKPKPTYPTTTAAPPVQAPPAPDRGVAQQSLPANQGPLPGSQQDFVINVGDRIYFDLDSYAIRADAQALLDAQATWLKRYGATAIRIEGNCDELGTREYNLALGARRANAVRDYLVGRGVNGERITTVSFGKEKPIDGGSGEEANAKNRNGHTVLVSGAR